MKIPQTVRSNWIYLSFWTKEKEGQGSEISKEIVNLQIVEEERNIHVKYIFTIYPQNMGHSGWPSQQAPAWSPPTHQT